MPYVNLRLFASSPLRLFVVTMFTCAYLTTANAQVEECGTPDITLAQMQAFLEEIDTSSTAIVASTALAATSPWRMCVWFYHLRNSDGSSDDQDTDPEQFIGAVNTYFAGTFEFIVCGITNIDNDDYSTLDIGSNSSNLSDLWAEVDMLNEPLSENCVHVFMLGDGSIHINGVPAASGYAHNPLQYDKPAVFLAYLDGKLWAHELGHYMGLPHTFAGGTANQYVHDVNTPVVIGGVSHTCIQTGDGFCDTPADPDDNSCSYNGQCQLISCNPSLDPLGVPYSPDPTLLMSYYSCRNRFSDEQHQRMRTLYLDHPDYAFLRNPADECVAPKYGYVERNCEGYFPANPIAPLIYVPVQVRGEATPYCNPQDNKTDNLGRFLINPDSCPLTGIRRQLLPDRNFGNDPLNGVSIFDVFLINKHNLGLSKFENPFQIIASDVNNSGSITTFDLSELNKLILGIYKKLPIDLSWRYVPKLFTESQLFKDDFYADPFTAQLSDPFQGLTRSYRSTLSGTVVPNLYTWIDFVSLLTNSGLASSEVAWSFTGVKIGDVNCNANREGSPFIEEDPEFQIAEGDTINIQPNEQKYIQIFAYTSHEVVAWQFGTRYSFDSLFLSEISPGPTLTDFSEDFFYNSFDSSLTSNTLKVAWFSEDAEKIDIDSTILLEFLVEANESAINIQDRFRLDNEVLPFLFYNEYGDTVPVTLQLNISDIPDGYKTALPPFGRNHQVSKSLKAKPYPVPFTSQIDFLIEIPENEQVSLEIYDSRGILISSTVENLASGRHELQISNISHHNPGFYWYIIKAGQQTIRGKLSKH